MNIILLSGGSGKRLWPLSNDIRSKQFIKIFKTQDGEYESMLQKMYNSLKEVDSDADITIATSKSQISAITNQLGENVGISIEPCRRDTFPAIALATSYLHDVKGVSEDEAVVVCPVDPYVERAYFESLKELARLASEDAGKLVLMGMEPTYPSEKYGYIIPNSKDNISKVDCFKEKPDEATAAEYIAKGALWNAGIFAYKLKYVLNKAHELINFTDYDDLFSKFADVKKISFDYAVAEREKDIAVLRFSGLWKDLGTWNTLTEVVDDEIIGNGICDDTCENTHILNELNVPILAMGLKNVVIAASPEGILVADKHQSSYMKPFVDKMDSEIMFAEKSWGSYRVVDVSDNSMTIKITLNPEHKMNYHSHNRRNEVWTVVSGKGYTIVDGYRQNVAPGAIITIEAGCKHTIVADTEIQLIEVQLGSEISVQDKVKYDFPED